MAPLAMVFRFGEMSGVNTYSACVRKTVDATRATIRDEQDGDMNWGSGAIGTWSRLRRFGTAS